MKKTRHTRRRRSLLDTMARRLGPGLLIAGLAVVAAYTGLAPTSGGAEQGTTEDAETYTGRVTKVVDGDTFWLDSVDVRIRIWGLDAPETDEPDGSQSTAALSKLIAGQELSCRERDIDRYGRIVGQCFLADGRDVAAEMIASEAAQEYCRFSDGYYGTC